MRTIEAPLHDAIDAISAQLAKPPHARRLASDLAWAECNQRFGSIPELARRLRTLPTELAGWEAHANNKIPRAADVLEALNRCRSVALGSLAESAPVTFDLAAGAYADLEFLRQTDISIHGTDLAAVEFASKCIVALAGFALGQPAAESTPPVRHRLR